jgi:hypothetical protein
VPGFVNYKKGALDSQLQVIKFTSCLPMVSGSLRVDHFYTFVYYCIYTIMLSEAGNLSKYFRG